MSGLWNIKSYISIKEGLYKQSQTARRSVVGVRRYSLHLPIGQSRSLLNNGQLGTTPSLLEGNQVRDGTRYRSGSDRGGAAKKERGDQREQRDKPGRRDRQAQKTGRRGNTQVDRSNLWIEPPWEAEDRTGRRRSLDSGTHGIWIVYFIFNKDFES